MDRPNPGKALVRSVRGVSYARHPIRTHVITDADGITPVVNRYARPHLAVGDTLVVSERVVAITQGRAIPIQDIRPSRLARILATFVLKPSWGIGIGSPWTMELALREAGTPRVLLAALVSAATKPLGVRGLFYRVAGRSVAAIDGPTSYTLPPYNRYATLGPREPDRVAERISTAVRVPVVIIDANDRGVAVLGASRGVDRALVREIFADNPLGQTDERTPLCIVRRVCEGGA